MQEGRIFGGDAEVLSRERLFVSDKSGRLATEPNLSEATVEVEELPANGEGVTAQQGGRFFISHRHVAVYSRRESAAAIHIHS